MFMSLRHPLPSGVAGACGLFLRNRITNVPASSPQGPGRGDVTARTVLRYEDPGLTGSLAQRLPLLLMLKV